MEKVTVDNYSALAGSTEPEITEKLVLTEAQSVALDNVLKCFLVLGGPSTDMLKRSIYYKQQTDVAAYMHKIVAEGMEMAKWVPEIHELTPDQYRLMHAAMGMLTESIEFLEALVRSMIPGAPPLDVTNMMEEIGDQNWYQSIPLRMFNLTWIQVMQANIDKLRARYPNKFELDKAVNRDLAKEREILETFVPKVEA